MNQDGDFSDHYEELLRNDLVWSPDANSVSEIVKIPDV